MNKFEKFDLRVSIFNKNLDIFSQDYFQLLFSTINLGQYVRSLMNVSNEVSLNPTYTTRPPTRNTKTLTKEPKTTPTTLTTTTSTTTPTSKAPTTITATAPKTAATKTTKTTTTTTTPPNTKNTTTSTPLPLPRFRRTIFVERYLEGDHIYAMSPCYQFRNTQFTYRNGGSCSCKKEHPIFHYIFKNNEKIEYGCFAVPELCKGIVIIIFVSLMSMSVLTIEQHNFHL